MGRGKTFKVWRYFENIHNGPKIWSFVVWASAAVSCHQVTTTRGMQRKFLFLVNKLQFEVSAPLPGKYQNKHHTML